MSRAEFRRAMVRHELITRPSIDRFCRRLVDIIADEIQAAGFDGWEDCLLRISDRIGEAMEELENTAEDLKPVLGRN
jgi:hypothetical protein